MTTLTRHLTWQGAHGESPSDLELHQLWPAAGRRAPRYTAAALMTTAAATPYLAGVVLGVLHPIVLHNLLLGTVVVIVTWKASRREVDLRRLDLSALRTSTGRQRIRRLFVSVGKLGFKLGLACGLLLGFVIAFPKNGIVGGLGGGLSDGPSGGLVVGLAWALAFGLPVGFVFVANSPWPRYLVATMILARRGDLPRRPAAFLDWAYDAGLMRLSGIAVQFRHREFQTWLATRDQPADGHTTKVVNTGPEATEGKQGIAQTSPT